MTEKIKLVQGDTRPAIVCTVTDETTGNALDITGATVVMKFRPVGNTTLQATIPGTVTSGSTGQVVFYPASSPAMLNGDAGDNQGEIEITFADNQVQTVYDLLKFKVREDF
jgi:hypothetical protein